MRVCIIFTLVSGFTTSLAAQTLDKPHFPLEYSGSATLLDHSLSSSRVEPQSEKFMSHTELWSLRFPDEVDYLGTKIDRKDLSNHFSEGKFLQSSNTSKPPAKNSIPNAIQKPAVGSHWWVDWPSTRFHNQFRPAVNLNLNERLELILLP